MDIERELKSILSIIGKSNISDNQKKVVTDNLANLTSKFNVLNEKCHKFEMQGINMVGDYDSQFQKAINILNLLGYDEQTFEGVNEYFLRWMVKSFPEQKYCGQLMNKYLIECWQVAYLLCQISDDRIGDMPEGFFDVSWSSVRDCLLNPIEHAEKTAEKKLIDLIEGVEPNELKIKLYNQYLKK